VKISVIKRSDSFNHKSAHQPCDIPRGLYMEDAMHFSDLAKLSGALILTTGLAGTANAQYHNGYSAQDACKSSENRSRVIGGGIGAVAGAVLGSQVGGRGARTEASVLGGVLGGLAGAGIGDKRVDCDPVYHSRDYQTSSTSTAYRSQPTYSTTSSSGYHHTASYPQPDYGVRTTVSDHPVYSNPTWGAQPARTYSSQTVSQPVYTQATYSQPTYSSSTTQYVSPTPTRTYARPVTTTYVQPTTYARSHSPRSYNYGHHGSHYHGKYACSDRH